MKTEKNIYKYILRLYITTNFEKQCSGKIGRKLLMALGIHYKNRWSPLCDVTTDEEVF